MATTNWSLWHPIYRSRARTRAPLISRAIVSNQIKLRIMVVLPAIQHWATAAASDNFLRTPSCSQALAVRKMIMPRATNSGDHMTSQLGHP
jgi:hypothetical protein